MRRFLSLFLLLPVFGFAVAPEVRRIGVNLAGAEFGREMPGTYGKEYTYPGARQFDYCRAKGIAVVRLPFRWERIQHSLLGPLDADELARLDAVAVLARERGIRLLLDMHNYARYRGQLIGSEEVPNAAFADVWSRLAAHYRDEAAIFAYGIMNEPHSTRGLWPAAAQACVDAIRAVDMETTLVVCGDGWSGAHSWPRINGRFLLDDPAGKLVYEAHQYFDRDNSGSYKKSYDEEGAYPDVGVDRLQPFVKWLEEHGAKGFIGEFGVPDDDPRWLVVLDRTLAEMRRHQLGGTYWAAGPWWGKYPLSVEPRDGQDRPQMAVLEQYAGDRDGSGDKPWIAAAETAETAARAAREAEAKLGRRVHDFGARKEAYHYGNEGSEFASEEGSEGDRTFRRISYRHVGEPAWVGFGLYFGTLDCRGHAAFTLDLRAEQPSRLEIKAYTPDGERFAGFFAVAEGWQTLVIPFAELKAGEIALSAEQRIQKIEFQPGTSRAGGKLDLGVFRLAAVP